MPLSMLCALKSFDPTAHCSTAVLSGLADLLVHVSSNVALLRIVYLLAADRPGSRCERSGAGR